MSRNNQDYEVKIPEPHVFVPMIRDDAEVSCVARCGIMCETCRTCSSESYHQVASKIEPNA